ncbi:phosphopyruvate hydratase, partial [Pelomicrobium sp. G1]
VAHVEGLIAQALLGRDAAAQAEIDGELARLDCGPHFARLGGNAAIAVSMAVLHAAATAHGEPLWRYLAEGEPVRLPLPQI